MTTNPKDNAKKNCLTIENLSIFDGKQQFADTIINCPNQPEPEIIPEVDIAHLPQPTTALIGREIELAQLTDAYTDSNRRLAILVAAGGIGKSALTDEWLQQIAEHNYYGKSYIFGWSFYSQGSHTTFTNSQPFFSAVLPFLGVTEIPKDEIEKARLLARCLQQKPCLLILDGLEPLQYPENLQSMNGELQDSALKEFIACFRRTASNSFVLLSSRQPLVELNKWHSEHYLSLPLETLPHDEGALLLEKLGVTGNTPERQAISKDLNGHALSLVLMGHLLSEHHQGDFHYARELPPLTSAHGSSDAEKDSRHALRVLDYYDSLQDETSRYFLQLLGLFDRPMSHSEKTVLIKQAQHAELLRALTEKQWQIVQKRLEKNGLLLGRKGKFKRLEWDTHPIIRSYFGQKFKEDHPSAFRQAHLTLFEYYQKVPEKKYPDTLEKMAPLYQAVVHGCLAKQYRQAFQLYWRRICRNGGKNGNNVYYSLYKLGAYSNDLKSLAEFFPFGWEVPDKNLIEDEQAEILATCSFCLMSLGRFQEAITPRKTCLSMHYNVRDWLELSSDSQNLVDLYLPIGNLEQANSALQQGFRYSLLSKDIRQQMINKSYLGTVLHRKGKLTDAYVCFQEARKLQRKRGYDELYSLSGFWHCSLLLDTVIDEYDLKKIIVLKTKQSNELKTATPLNDLAYNLLTIASAYLALNEMSHAGDAFKQAVQQIQKSNMIHCIPPFYLLRANFYLISDQLDLAKADLETVLEIIECYSMASLCSRLSVDTWTILPRHK